MFLAVFFPCCLPLKYHGNYTFYSVYAVQSIADAQRAAAAAAALAADSGKNICIACAYTHSHTQTHRHRDTASLALHFNLRQTIEIAFHYVYAPCGEKAFAELTLNTHVGRACS